MSDTESDDGFLELQEIIRDHASSVSTLTKANCEENHDETTTVSVLQLPKCQKEKYLEKIVFNKKDELYENLAKVANGRIAKVDDETTVTSIGRKRETVWHDSDDDDYQVGDIIQERKKQRKSNGTSVLNLVKDKNYKEFLIKKFQNVHEPPKWADLDHDRESGDSNSDDDDKKLLKTVGFKSTITTHDLPPNHIQMKRLKDLNRSTYAEGSVTSVQFHPKSIVGMVAGYTGVCSLYAIDGIRNEKLHNIQFERFPIKCAKILNNGDEILIGSSKKFYYSIDLMTGKEKRNFLPTGAADSQITKFTLFEISKCDKYIVVAGRFGEIHLLDRNSNELIHTFKQETPCTALQFSANSQTIFSHSSTGSMVSIFDLRQQRMQHNFIDDGCINGKTLTISPNNQWLVTGSNEGIVNIYNYTDVLETKQPKPKKIIANLTTAISTTKFNHSSELLGICSELISDGVKLVHFPSGTVYSNFPTQRQNASIGHATSMEFSPFSGYMAIGSRENKVPLLRLKHFKNY